MDDASAAPGWLVSLAALLEASWLGATMRDSPFLYPLVNIAHLIGLILIVGGIGLLDLRMLGVARGVPLPAIYPYLTRLAVTGVCLQVGSGIFLFASDAGALLRNEAFILKMLLFTLALANAGLFRLTYQNRVADWDRRPPFFGLLQSALSLALWLTIGILGRLIAYV